MWRTFRAWFIHLFTPHCDECNLRNRCNTCETLQHQLNLANDQIRLLTQALINSKVEQVESPTVNQESMPQPIRPRAVMPSRVRMELEENDRAMAQARARAEKNLEKPVEEITLKDLEDELQEVKAARDAKVN